MMSFDSGGSAAISIEQHLCRSAVVRDRSEGLVDFVRDGTGHLARRGEAQRLPQALFGALPLIHHHPQEQAGQASRPPARPAVRRQAARFDRLLWMPSTTPIWTMAVARMAPFMPKRIAIQMRGKNSR